MGLKGFCGCLGWFGFVIFFDFSEEVIIIKGEKVY